MTKNRTKKEQKKKDKMDARKKAKESDKKVRTEASNSSETQSPCALPLDRSRSNSRVCAFTTKVPMAEFVLPCVLCMLSRLNEHVMARI